LRDRILVIDEGRIVEPRAPELLLPCVRRPVPAIRFQTTDAAS
jgi:hypothetical protein